MWKLSHISVVADGPRVIWRYIYRGVSTIFFLFLDIIKFNVPAVLK